MNKVSRRFGRRFLRRRAARGGARDSRNTGNPESLWELKKRPLQVRVSLSRFCPFVRFRFSVRIVLFIGAASFVPCEG